MPNADHRSSGRAARGALAAAAVLLLIVPAGCSRRHTPGSSALGSAPPTTASPGTPTTPASTTPSATRTSPAPTRTIRTTPALRPRGDLTIHLAGPCTWYQDVDGNLWLNPTLAASWTGPAPFPSNGFSMISNYGKKTAGGPVTSAAPFTWAIGGEPTAGNAFLGHTVKLTVTIDPVHTVAETNEANNVTVVTVVVPSTPPPSSGTEETITCY
jgi:hypothetical protein